MSTATRTARRRQQCLETETRPVKARTPIPAPQREYHFEVSGEFPIFGRWREPAVHIAAPGNERQLALWLAANESAGASQQSLWASCVENNPGAFTELRAMDLFDSSLDLPRGTVVLRSIEAPQWIKDDPPGEILDRLAVVRQRYPAAKVWLHEPVFRRPSGDEAPALLTSEMLNQQADQARQAVWATYHKARLRCKAEFHARRIWQWLARGWSRFRQQLASHREAVALRSSYLQKGESSEVDDYIARARELGKRTEADSMHATAYGRAGMSPQSLAGVWEFEDVAAPTSLEPHALIRHGTIVAAGGLAVLAGLAAVAVPVAMLSIPSLLVIDPILTYTMPDDENRHWFIGHWDWKQSAEGTKTLVYV